MDEGSSSECSFYSMKEDPVVVILMGCTGSGRTTCINTATGSQEPVGHGLKATTTTIRVIKSFHPRDKFPVVFVDTPGWDSERGNDEEILQEISQWFIKSDFSKLKLLGILYLHPISDIRMVRTTLRSIRLLKELCGDSNLNKVIFLTTMWKDINSSVGAQREKELRERYLVHMIELGLGLARFEDTRESAWSVLEPLFASEAVINLKFQTELKFAGAFAGTSAGAIIEEQRKENLRGTKAAESWIRKLFRSRQGGPRSQSGSGRSSEPIIKAQRKDNQRQFAEGLPNSRAEAGRLGHIKPQRTEGQVAKFTPDISLPFGIKELVPGVEPTVDIIAIHGLDGHREGSWTADGGVLWLTHQDFLPKLIPQARVVTFGYDAHTRDDEGSISEFLFEHARQFLNKLSLHRRLDETDQRPIIFVCHSLGGLLLKTALIDANARHGDHLQDHKSIFKSTYGILFLGTPQMGIDSTHLPQYFFDLLSISRPTNIRLLNHLKSTSEALKHQLEQYVAIQERFVTKVYYEMHDTPVFGSSKRMVVGKDSAFVAGTRNVPLIGLHKNHLTMTKFANPDDEDYKTVSSHLLLMARDAPVRIARLWKKESSSPTSCLQNLTFPATQGPESSSGQHQVQVVQPNRTAIVYNSRSRSSSTTSLGLRGGDIWELNVLVSGVGARPSRLTVEVPYL